MINIYKTKNIKSDYPVVQADNFLSNKICKNIRKEIIRFGNFDDFFVVDFLEKNHKISQNLKDGVPFRHQLSLIFVESIFRRSPTIACQEKNPDKNY